MMVMMMMMLMMMTTTMMVDVVVDLNSFICKRPFFAKNNFREFFSTPCFLSRGYGSPSLCCLDALKLNVNSNCASDLGDSQRQIEGHVGIISPGNNKSFSLTGSLDAAKVLGCCLGYGLGWAPSLSPLLSRNTLAKNLLQINQDIHTLNRACGWSSTSLQVL